MEDIRLGRASSASFYTATSAGSNHVTLVPANNRRIALTISADGQGTVFVGPKNTFVDGAKGIALTAGNPVVKFTIEELGSAMWQPWVIDDGGVPIVCVAISVELEKE